MAIAHALTIDVEEWFHDDWRPARGVDWRDLPSTVARDVTLLLDLLARTGARATFFVLGDVARRQPDLVKRIAAAGHEIASHGDAHRLVPTQNRAEFAADVRDSIAVLSECAGVRIAGYRAPYFLRRPRDLWAIDVLAELGLRYDTSYAPVRWMPYLGRGIPRAPYRHPCGVWEFPLPFAERFGGWNLPYAGGGPLLRFLPYRVVEQALRAHEAAIGPAVVYCHPWELDAEVRSLPGTPRHVRLWKRLGRARMLPALTRLLATFPFRPIREVYANELAA
ncbi:MAG: polysaccharide deacetylase family protein [Deltaproteobacteria bacterium]|nr:polysaccharide deacetylase family protein [Deltaproteobacteria bacterium]